LLLVLTNGTYDISQDTADNISDAMKQRETVVSIPLDIFDEGHSSMATLAIAHVVALIDYRRPDAHLVGLASGKVRSLIQ
jgi:hypothetical protein